MLALIDEAVEFVTRDPVDQASDIGRQLVPDIPPTGLRPLDGATLRRLTSGGAASTGPVTAKGWEAGRVNANTSSWLRARAQRGAVRALIGETVAFVAARPGSGERLGRQLRSRLTEAAERLQPGPVTGKGWEAGRVNANISSGLSGERAAWAPCGR
ncbi:MAG: hypothetical protein U0Q16_31935 [Bryobacteraceae bacterium]